MEPIITTPGSSISRRWLLRFGAGLLGTLGAGSAFASPEPRRSAKSVILFWMWGGPSQFETFDPKPDAPVEYRGPFRPINTTVPGMDMCELFPRLATHGRRIALIRSLHHTMASHNDGSIEVLTGKTPTVADPTSTAKSDHPDFGMIASRQRGLQADGLPQYIGIPTAPFMTRPMYLGLQHQAFVAGDPSAPGYAPPSLGLTGGVTVEQFASRRQLLGQFDQLRCDMDVDGRFDGSDRLRQSAFQLLSNPQVAQAFDLGREDTRLRDRYGRHLWGQSCLLARRLAEAGTGVVIIDALAPVKNQRIYFSWDDHANAQPGWDLAEGMRWRAPFMDQALAALIEDIHQRGSAQDILVLALGEFGRTPRVTTNSGNLGRDHWPQAMCALASGGGMRMGQVIGATNSRGEYPKERALSPQDLLATVYHHLGIDWRHEFHDFTGRPIPIVSGATPIRELI